MLKHRKAANVQRREILALRFAAQTGRRPLLQSKKVRSGIDSNGFSPKEKKGIAEI